MLSALEGLLFFHMLSFVESLVRYQRVRALFYAAAKTENTIAIVNQLVLKIFTALCLGALLLPLSKVVAAYIKVDRQLVMFTVLSLCVTGFSPISQSESLNDVFGP